MNTADTIRFFDFKKYSWSIARNDLIAGATVAAIAVPQAIAYALIAGVDPKYGLYSAVVIAIVGSLFNSSSHLINGPSNAIRSPFSALWFPLPGSPMPPRPCSFSALSRASSRF